MLIVACISGHGYGHGSRVAALLAALQKLEPHCRFVLSTPLPKKFLNQTFAAIPHIHHHCQWDVGVIQADALASDPLATLKALDELEPNLAAQVEKQVALITALRCPGEAALVLADVPPAAVLLAEGLGVPLVWQANFGWDSIYQELGGPLLSWAEQSNQLYRRGSATLRCPFSLGMDWDLPLKQIGLSAGTPSFTSLELRQRFGWGWDKQKTALLSFGGIGFACTHQLLERWPDWGFVVTDPELAKASNARLLPADLRPLDLMPICSVVITKPGYSTFCEALSQGLGVIAVERQGFAEAEVLMAGLKEHGWHRQLSLAAFLAGDWHLDTPLTPPTKPALTRGGEIEAAQFLVEILRTSNSEAGGI